MFKIEFPNKEKTVIGFKRAVAAVRSVAIRAGKATACVAVKVFSFINIGMEFAAKYLLEGFYRMKSVRVRAVAVGLVTALSLSATAVVYAAERRPAVGVCFGGKHFGYVADMQSAEHIADTVSREVHGKLDADSFKLESTIVLGGDLTDSGKIMRAVTNNGVGIVAVCGLYVDGALVAVADDLAAMQSALSAAVKDFLTDGAEFAGYANSIVLRDITATEEFAAEKALDIDTMLSGGYGVQILTVRTEEYMEEIACKSVTEYDENRDSGYEKVTQKGENGLRFVTADVTYINGRRYTVSELESNVVMAPVDEVVTVGTKKSTVYHSGYVPVASILSDNPAEMIFPVACSDRAHITSFWGDDREHKGLDISAPGGSDILAAASGVVSYVGHRDDYGNVIIIDHYDGKTQTVYSHNKKNLVSKGQEVTAGQLIAFVGATGNATGNHLHFEVRINGTAVDAAPYVGLK